MTSVAQLKDRPESTKVPVPPPIQAIVDAKDRTDGDRRLDAGRHPGELLAFLGLGPGMRVAELAAGGQADHRAENGANGDRSRGNQCLPRVVRGKQFSKSGLPLRVECRDHLGGVSIILRPVVLALEDEL